MEVQDVLTIYTTTSPGRAYFSLFGFNSLSFSALIFSELFLFFREDEALEDGVIDALDPGRLLSGDFLDSEDSVFDTAGVII